MADARPSAVRAFKVLATLKKRWPLLLLLLGSGPAVLVLGFGLSNGRLSTTRRPAEAKPWRAEAKRYLEANDCVKAEQVLQKAAQAGDADAMDQLGQLYLYGPALYRDDAQAREWFQKAAQAGNVPAMSHLGQLHLCGWGVPQDSAQARQWYQKAAEGGDSEAMYGLGWLYEHGWGGERDCTLARRWYQKAAAGDNPGAKRALARLPSK
jgi:TPR repeat protein